MTGFHATPHPYLYAVVMAGVLLACVLLGWTTARDIFHPNHFWE